MGTQLPTQKGGTAAPTFRPMSIVVKRSSISATAELLLLNLACRYGSDWSIGQSDFILTVLAVAEILTVNRIRRRFVGTSRVWWLKWSVTQFVIVTHHTGVQALIAHLRLQLLLSATFFILIRRTSLIRSKCEGANCLEPKIRHPFQ